MVNNITNTATTCFTLFLDSKAPLSLTTYSSRHHHHHHHHHHHYPHRKSLSVGLHTQYHHHHHHHNHQHLCRSVVLTVRCDYFSKNFFSCLLRYMQKNKQIIIASCLHCGSVISSSSSSSSSSSTFGKTNTMNA
uniref:Uncharacterized protein n=1 Tax=Glossina morsitans morsitans TaxID=37546 RepID=A0A1B0G4K3_GLOMM